MEGQKSVLGMYCVREEFMLNTHYNNLFLLLFMFCKKLLIINYQKENVY